MIDDLAPRLAVARAAHARGCRGNAHVEYQRRSSAWAFQAYIKANNTGLDDGFGTSVALSGDGDTLAVGATAEDGSGIGVSPASDNSARDSGAAYVYRRSSGTWAFEAYIKESNTGEDDRFGASVALSGDGIGR